MLRQYRGEAIILAASYVNAESYEPIELKNHYFVVVTSCHCVSLLIYYYCAMTDEAERFTWQNYMFSELSSFSIKLPWKNVLFFKHTMMYLIDNVLTMQNLRIMQTILFVYPSFDKISFAFNVTQCFVKMGHFGCVHQRCSLRLYYRWCRRCKINKMVNYQCSYVISPD